MNDGIPTAVQVVFRPYVSAHKKSVNGMSQSTANIVALAARSLGEADALWYLIFKDGRKPQILFSGQLSQPKTPASDVTQTRQGEIPFRRVYPTQ